jgi:uncharacterized Fe-S cluster protein YjdI
MNLKEWAEQLIAESKRYEPCMSVFVSEAGQYVELRIDTSRPTYGRHVPGIVGGDCCLLCDFETDEIIGVHLRVIHQKLQVCHDGPLRINEGFLKEESTVDTPTRTYEHDGLKVEWRAPLCTHCGNCGASLPEVFDAERKPWVDLTKADSEAIKKTVGECPSGALKLAE